MTLSRRDVVLGGGLLAGAAGALALTPRGTLNLLAGRKLEGMIPNRVGEWQLAPSQSVVLPRREGTLSAKLYSQLVNRTYVSPRDPPIFLVIAFGDTQSDLLQLHRPEACYAAVGYQIASSVPITIPLGVAAALPARRVVATREERVEPIVYWTRIGDRLPDSGRGQRVAKLMNDIDGVVTDGVLVRLSTIGDPTPEVADTLARFARGMVAGMTPANRPVLIGRPLAQALLSG